MALGFGFASWRWVETPFRRSAHPALPRAGILAGVGLMAALAVLGGAVALADAKGWRNLTWAGWQPAEIEAMKEEREPLVGSGTCHLATRDDPSAPFLHAWNCRGQTDGTYRGWPVALFGDSHGGNFSMVLRLTGRNPMQLTMWGCSLAPTLMRPDCREAAEQLRTAAREAGIGTVILVNRWARHEVTPERLVEIELYWGEVFPNIVLVSPLPAFRNLDDRLIRWPRERVLRIPVDMEVPEAFAAARKRIAGSTLTIIDGAALFCGDRPGCTPIDKGPLMDDAASHMTIEGAEGYATRLEATGILQALAP
jgi:hypothetical protein